MKSKVISMGVVLLATVLVISVMIKVNNIDKDEHITFGNKKVLSEYDGIIINDNWKRDITSTLGESLHIQLSFYDFKDNFNEGYTLTFKGNDIYDLEEITITPSEEEDNSNNKYYKIYNLSATLIPKKEGIFNIDDLKLEAEAKEKSYTLNFGKINLNVLPKVNTNEKLEVIVGSSYTMSHYREEEENFSGSFNTEIENVGDKDIVIKDVQLNKTDNIKMEKFKETTVVKPGDKQVIDNPYKLNKEIANYQYTATIIYNIDGVEYKTILDPNTIVREMNPNQIVDIIKEKDNK